MVPLSEYNTGFQINLTKKILETSLVMQTIKYDHEIVVFNSNIGCQKTPKYSSNHLQDMMQGKVHAIRIT